MKKLMKPIKMIAWFTEEGKLHPLKFQMIENDQKVTVKIDRVVHVTEEKLAGNKMMVYRCQSTISGLEKVYELRYEISPCRWYLDKA